MAPLARRLLSSSLLVVVSVAAVVLVLVLPSWVAGRDASGPAPPQPPAPRLEVDQVGTQTWSALVCPRRGLGCRVPLELDLGGARFVHRSSHRLAVLQRDRSTRTLVRTVSPNSGRRWLLVGADGAGPSSRLSVSLGDGPAGTIPAGTLSFLSVPGTHRPVRVVLSDLGTASGHEVLRIEEYDAQD